MANDQTPLNETPTGLRPIAVGRQTEIHITPRRRTTRLTITLPTVIFHTLRAALANPSKGLRGE